MLLAHATERSPKEEKGGGDTNDEMAILAIFKTQRDLKKSSRMDVKVFNTGMRILCYK